MPPPPAEPLATRLLLGPALRTQPDRRLVKLVREGYEAAFEEIVRRYRKPLDRFAAAIVGGHSEDVTQDAFSKALLALRGSTAEIELKPWLYRIVRNTALNEIRDGPPPTEELGEAIAGGHSAAVEAERREEIGELMERLRALPEPQRAAIVMRELEGLSHEEIAAALGVSGGAARQAIYRARLALRDGLGLLVPLPLLRVLFDHGAEAAAGAGAGGAVAAAGAASAAGGGAGASLGGVGAAGALKVGLATAVLAGSVGAGVAIQHDRGGRGPDPAEAAVTLSPAGDAGGPAGSGREPVQAPALDSRRDRAKGSGSSDDRDGDDRGRGSGGPDDDSSADDSGSGTSSGHGSRGGSGHGGRDSERGEHSGRGGHSGRGDGADEDDSGGRRSGRHSSSGAGSDDSSGGGRGSGSAHGTGSGAGESGGGHGSSGGSSHSGGSGGGNGHDDSGASDAPAPTTIPSPAPEPPPVDSGDGSGGNGSGSGGSGSGDDDQAGGEIDP